jgi:hypothetical protein
MIQEQRFFAGKYFFPKPKLEFDENLNTLILTITWGDETADSFAREIIKETMNQTSENTEVTRVGRYVEPLTEDSPKLLEAVKRANDLLQKKYNSAEYNTVVEVLLIKKNKSDIHWIKSGGPHLLLLQPHLLHCIDQVYSLSSQYHQPSPLVTQGLGIEDSALISMGSFHLRENEKIVLASRNYLPGTLFVNQERSIDSLALTLASDDPQLPFWIASI